MVETQSRNTMSRPVDCFLQSLVEIVNDESADIPITLSVGGLLISGDMIGGRTYFDEFARRFKDGFRDISSETSSTIEETFKRLGDVYDPIQKESQGSAAIPKPYLIHLKDAQIYQSGAGLPLSEKNGFVAGTIRSCGRILAG